MKVFRNILLLISLTFISCNQKETSHQDIYDFIEIVIKEQQLDKNHAISITPESRFSISESDDVTFNEALFEIQQKEQKQKAFDKNEDYVFTFNIVNYLKKLTKEDIYEMQRQKKELTRFKWDNSRLGFNQSNKTNSYTFSVPLFSKDRTKAVMMINDLCSGLCGNGKSIFFSKENGEWTSAIASFWFH
ncbi:MAG: hypothetical protein AB8B65_13910 [Kordia sp.]|uniref:hypothetical protein n=1 Tax=Kordia sp. TaxID=1965332 RepID=UPI00385EC613